MPRPHRSRSPSRTTAATTWQQHQISAAANNSQRNPPDGCTIRTDSNGTAYVFGVGTVSSQGKAAFELMSRSTNGGTTWSQATPVAGPVTQPGVFDPVVGRPTIDGVAGARSDLAPAPSVDIANGAPTGTDATNRIVMTYVSGDIAAPHVFFTESTDGGNTWSAPRAIESAGDRGIYTAPAISPNGTDVYVVYNAFTTPYRTNTTDPRSLVGVVLHADQLDQLRHRHRRVLGAAPQSGRRSARLVSEQPRRGVPRRLRLRRGDEDVRRGRMERHASSCRLPRDRHMADVAGDRRIGAHAGTGAGLCSELRQLRHLRRHVQRPDAVTMQAREGAATEPPPLFGREGRVFEGTRASADGRLRRRALAGGALEGCPAAVVPDRCRGEAGA